MAMSFLVYRREKSLVHKLPALLKITLLFFISIRVFSSSEFFLFKSFDKDFLFINTAIFFRTLFYFIKTLRKISKYTLFGQLTQKTRRNKCVQIDETQYFFDKRHF